MQKNNSTNKTVPVLVLIGTIVLVVGALVWLARPGQDVTSSQEQLTNATTLVAQEQTFDFGEISMADGKVTHDFVVANTSAEPITLNKMFTSCMCTEAELEHAGEVSGRFGMPGHGAMPKLEETIAPGDNFKVKAIYDPSAHGPTGVGPVDRKIRMETSSGEFLELQVLAVVTP